MINAAPIITVLAATGRDVDTHRIAVMRTSEVLPVPHCVKIYEPPIRFRSNADQMRWQMRSMRFFVDTPFVITVHTDGFGLHRDNWDDSFLAYDYIGAPWPPANVANLGYPAECRVGNGGLTLRSRKWMETSALLDLPDGGEEDVFCCMKNRQHFLDAGCKIAPIEVAIKFSFENPIPEFPEWTVEQSFGFHSPWSPHSLRKL